MSKSFTPSHTPPSLKILLGSIAIASVCSAFTSPYLGLSAIGIDRFYLWQFASYLFVHPFPSGILHLAFNLYLIWTFGASLMERLHPGLFFSLFFGSGICAGLLAWGGMVCFNLASPLYGCSSALYALLTAWIILNPEARILLFLTIPIKARHLLLTLIGFNFLVDLSRSDWIPLIAYIGAVLFGYFFTILSCRMRSPFPFMAWVENGMFSLIERMAHIREKPIHHTKIYDFKSGEPILGDEDFMDAMLSRISLYGEDALSPEEKKRMQQISEKKSLGKK